MKFSKAQFLILRHLAEGGVLHRRQGKWYLCDCKRNIVFFAPTPAERQQVALPSIIELFKRGYIFNLYINNYDEWRIQVVLGCLPETGYFATMLGKDAIRAAIFGKKEESDDVRTSCNNMGD